MFDTVDELLRALHGSVCEAEYIELETLAVRGLPPVVSRAALSTMLGVNPGLIWSFMNRPNRHYRRFQIPKGREFRTITAPKVGLKIIQKWLSVQLQKQYAAPDHVFGFVPDRSHIQAAKVHLSAQWVFSVDVRDFFPTTPRSLVQEALRRHGFIGASVEIISKLACVNEGLAQGAPTSPVLSNMCFSEVDQSLRSLALRYAIRLSRYADDIVFSGDGAFPHSLPLDVSEIFEETPWRLADEKTELASLPRRLKVHGLLVHGDRVRLTKGYRNRLRAYRHLLDGKLVRTEDLRKLSGHVAYADSVARENG